MIEERRELRPSFALLENASRLRRAAAVALDGLLALILAVALYNSLGYFAALGAVRLFRIGAPDSIWHGAWAWWVGLFGNFFFDIPLCRVLVSSPMAFGIPSPAQFIMGLRIEGERGATPSPRAQLLRWAIYAAPGLLYVLALATGAPAAASASLACLLALIPCSAVPVAMGRAALPDRLCNTAIARAAGPADRA